MIFFRREVVNLNGKIGDLALDYPNAQSAKSYFSNDEVYSVFDMLVKVFLRNINILPESHCKFVIWLTIERYAIDYFSDIWFKKYGHYFLDIENLSLEQCVSNYCLIDIFNRDSFDNIGMFTYFLMKNGKFTNSGDGFISSNSYLTPLVLKEIEEKKIESFERNLLDPKTKITFSMNDIDLMNGIEFENFVSLLFKKMNYSTEITKGSGDQGIDIIAEKNEERIGIQAKCYSNSVSNSAIQEVVAGISHYRCSKGIVVTNNFFTKSAIELASSNNIVLWDRDILKEKIMELF